MAENKSTLKIVIYFIAFLLFAGIVGGIVALAKQLLHKNGFDAPYITAILAAIMIFAYYKAWKWMCRKLDLFATKQQ